MIGLPFTSSGTAGYRPAISIFVYDCAVDISTYISGLVQNNSTKVYIREGGLAGGGSDLGEHFNSNSQFYFQATYRVA